MASLRSLLGRRASLPSPARSDDHAAAGELVRSVKRAQARSYAAGLQDGVTITLELLLGRESHGGVPYRGEELPADARRWAESALARSVDTAEAIRGHLDDHRWPVPLRPTP